MRIGYWAISVPIWLLGISSYFAYTTAGFDFEVPTRAGADVFYYRLRWDDGSTWAGMAVQPVARPFRRLDWFDPGGTLLARPTHPAHSTWWNRLGFWRVTTPTADPYMIPRYSGARVSAWYGLPSWLVLLAWSWPLLWRIRARLRKAPGRPEPIPGGH